MSHIIITLYFPLLRIVSWRGRVVRFRDRAIDKRGDRRKPTAENLLTNTYLLESAKWKTAAETADGGRCGLLRVTQRVPLLLLKKYHCYIIDSILSPDPRRQ